MSIYDRVTNSFLKKRLWTVLRMIILEDIAVRFRFQNFFSVAIVFFSYSAILFPIYHTESTYKELNEPHNEKTCFMRTTKTQVSLRIRAV